MNCRCVSGTAPPHRPCLHDLGKPQPRTPLSPTPDWCWTGAHRWPRSNERHQVVTCPRGARTRAPPDSHSRASTHSGRSTDQSETTHDHSGADDWAALCRRRRRVGRVPRGPAVSVRSGSRSGRSAGSRVRLGSPVLGSRHQLFTRTGRAAGFAGDRPPGPERAGRDAPGGPRKRHAVDIKRVVESGDPAAVLLRRSEGADMLVVGSRGHGGFDRLLMGSVSEKCVRHATCSVIVIRPGA